MINKTPDPIPLIPEQELLARFKTAVYAAGEYDLARRAEGKTSTTMPPIHRVLNEWLNHADSLTENDLSTIYKFFDAFSGARKSDKDMAKAQAVLKINGVGRSNLLCVNSWLKHVFMSLWVQKAVLLPMSFTIGTSFSKDELREFLPAFAMCSYHNKDRGVGALGLKLVLASTWYGFADFDIDECGDFAMFFDNKENRQLIGAPGNHNRYANSILTGVLRTWTKHGQDQGFAYSDADISNFIYWAEVARRNDTQLKPSEFIPQANMRRRRVMAQSRHQHRRKKDAAQVDLIEHHEKSDLKAKVLAGDMTLQAAQLYALLDKGPIQYIRYIRAKSGTRLSISGDYPYRMHVYPEKIWIKWNSCFDSYFDYRARQGFEKTGAWETFRYIFQDYLCCYLPWWSELNPSSEVVIPADPSVFFRFGFWVAGQPDRAAPDPLLNFHRNTRGGMSGVVNGLIYDANSFFEFCRAHGPNLNLIDVEFTNPVVAVIDRVVERGARKTNKKPISKDVLPYLLRYAYATEDFYIKLQTKVLESNTDDDIVAKMRRLQWELRSSEEPIDYLVSDWGTEASFQYEGVTYHLDRIPRAVSWATRTIKAANGGTRQVYLPHISGLRMVISALEAGVRFQGIQWLCQRSFNSLWNNSYENAELLPLVVSTDKVKNKAWKTLIVKRLHSMLLREQAFQSLFAEDGVNSEVNYEYRVKTRFAPVVPLFRAVSNSGPVGDRAYITAWERLLISFAIWYNANVETDEPLEMWSFVPQPDALTGTPSEAIWLDGNEQYRYCPINLKLEHTPHSTRATFISARNGILPIEATMMLVGHTNKKVTYYYTIDSEAEVHAKVLVAANAVWAPDKDNPVHIRADAVNSSLRTAFEKDREQTEEAFGFRTISLINEENASEDGIALLRTTPMANIVFRETHVCPVGELCPSNVLELIVEPRRCGLCPLAVKTVEHIPAMTAKMRSLLEQIEEAISVIEMMRKRKEPAASISAVADRRRLDVLEYESWKLSLLIAEEDRRKLEFAPKTVFRVGMPDVVRLHLKMVAKDSDVASFLIERLTDSRHYSTFETPNLRAKAAQLRQRLVSSGTAVRGEMDSVEEIDPVDALLSTLKISLESRGVEPTFRKAVETARASMVVGQQTPHVLLEKSGEAGDGS